MMQEPHLLRITAHHTPHRSDPPEAHLFYAALGKFVVAWGRFEGHFTGALLQILALPNAHAISRKLPISWEGRAEVWRESFARMSSLALFRAQALSFVDIVMAEVGSRHLGAHAIWDEFVADAVEPTMRARTIRPRKGSIDTIEIADYVVALSGIEADLITANELNEQLVPITTFLGSLRPLPPGINVV
jgi:hypothetical protein